MRQVVGSLLIVIAGVLYWQDSRDGLITSSVSHEAAVNCAHLWAQVFRETTGLGYQETQEALSDGLPVARQAALQPVNEYLQSHAYDTDGNETPDRFEAAKRSIADGLEAVR